jgi:hypothetical protein
MAAMISNGRAQTSCTQRPEVIILIPHSGTLVEAAAGAVFGGFVAFGLAVA